ncbi:hypothetical protein CYY_003319 [Polysphondylium violaceum]|uniref:Terpene synthase n=1 Tax=Polysphondylium violaceum TaxID=133409 RepID=A0A8J4PXX1_9MYCE|nr:hypothetical protein CYY_003319 [Polysphondylium violaceum]
MTHSISNLFQYIMGDPVWSSRLGCYKIAQSSMPKNSPMNVSFLDGIVKKYADIGLPIKEKIKTILSLDKLYWVCFLSPNISKDDEQVYEIAIKGLLWGYVVDDYFDDHMEFYSQENIESTVKQVKRINDIFQMKKSITKNDTKTLVEMLTWDLVYTLKSYTSQNPVLYNSIFQNFLQKCIEYTNSFISFNMYKNIQEKNFYTWLSLRKLNGGAANLFVLSFLCTCYPSEDTIISKNIFNCMNFNQMVEKYAEVMVLLNDLASYDKDMMLGQMEANPVYFLQRCNKISKQDAQEKVMKLILESMSEIIELEKELSFDFRDSLCVDQLFKDLSWLLFGLMTWGPQHYSQPPSAASARSVEE